MWRIRQAMGADANDAARLILESAPLVLPSIFSCSVSHPVEDFLALAFCQPKGQYGYANHWVVEQTEQVVALGCCWISELPIGFAASTFDSLTKYYPTEMLLTVLHRSQALLQVFPGPLSNELCIGHLAVCPKQQRQGIGRGLLEHFQRMAFAQGKTALVLDVEANNLIALNCYLGFGFVPVGSCEDQSELALGRYLHMRKAL